MVTTKCPTIFLASSSLVAEEHIASVGRDFVRFRIRVFRVGGFKSRAVLVRQFVVHLDGEVDEVGQHVFHNRRTDLPSVQKARHQAEWM